jgi:hypothetical protein
MPELKLKQLQYESDTWKRLLSFMVEENVRLKNRLAEILKEQFNASLLEEVELFQSSFLKEDELIGLLRNEIVEFDKLLAREIFEDGKIMREVEKKMIKLRNNIDTAEKQFGKLKAEFNSYLIEKI